MIWMHFSDIMNTKDESALSSGLKALIRERRDEGASSFAAKNEKMGDIGCLRKNCSRTFSNSSQLKQHVQTHHGKEYKCEKCGNVFNDPISLRSHKNHLTLCGEEEKVSSLKLYKSLDQNTTRRSQYCEENSEAGRYLSTSDILTELIMFPPNSSPQTVANSTIPNDDVEASPPGSTCSSSSKILEELVKFTPIDFQDSKEILEPTLFKVPASSQINLIDPGDMQSETNLGAGCSKSFPRKRSEPKFECQVCWLAFDKKATLKEHLLVHSKWGHDRKSWGCQICKLCFSTRNDLRRHTKSIHTVTIGHPGANLPVVGKLKQFKKHKQTEVIWLE